MLIKLEISNQVFEPGTFRSFAGNQAREVNAALFSSWQACKRKAWSFTGCSLPTASIVNCSGCRAACDSMTSHARRIHSHAPDYDFCRFHFGVVFENEAPVELRNSHAERAVPELGVEIGAVQQQVRTVQGQAEVDIEQTRRNHRNPRGEISVMHMDVLHAAPLQLQGVAGTEQRVQ